LRPYCNPSAVDDRLSGRIDGLAARFGIRRGPLEFVSATVEQGQQRAAEHMEMHPGDADREVRIIATGVPRAGDL
jgi:hypothetical protein